MRIKHCKIERVIKTERFGLVSNQKMVLLHHGVSTSERIDLSVSEPCSVHQLQQQHSRCGQEPECCFLFFIFYKDSSEGKKTAESFGRSDVASQIVVGQKEAFL